MTTEQFIIDLAVGGFLEPVGRKTTYVSSRLAVLSDGTTSPVLHLLALAKFATWPEDRFPFWIDGNRRNEMLSNVELAVRLSSAANRVAQRRKRRAKDAPKAGTPEYMKAWRAEHKTEVAASQKRYADRRRAVLRKVKELAESSEDDPVLEKLRRAVEGA